MGKITRRRHTREFKISIIRELESGKNLAQLSRESNLHSTMISRWRLEYRKIQNPPSAAVEIPIKKLQGFKNCKGLSANYMLRMIF
jgi:transposase-like protein